jgi:hypothetical protein
MVKNSAKDETKPDETKPDETKPTGDEKTGDTKPAGDEKKPAGDGKTPSDPPAQNEKRKLTMEDLPPEAQEYIANAQKIVNNQRDRLIKGILANKSCKLTEDQLKVMKTDVLEGLAASFQNEDAEHRPAFELEGFDFSGAGGFAANAGSYDAEDDEPLTAPPTFNAERYAASKSKK